MLLHTCPIFKYIVNLIKCHVKYILNSPPQKAQYNMVLIKPSCVEKGVSREEFRVYLCCQSEIIQ